MQNWPKRHLPQNKTPVGTRCIQVTIPDDDEWERIMYSECYQLALWMLWDRDDGKNGTVVARQWRKALQTWQHCDGSPSPVSGAGADTEMSIRQDPDNPCLFQSSVDGINWCTFADISKCTNFGNQPGTGVPQPASGGGTQQTCAVLHARGKLLLPTSVSTGDTISLDSASGAGNDPGDPGGSAIWREPNGNQFFLGFDVGFPTTDGSDPLPSVHHMKIIVGYGTTPAYGELTVGTPFTVPSGVANQPVWIQVNDSDLTNNDGNYSVCVTVTNNATPVSGPFIVTVDQGSGSSSVNPGDILTFTSDALTNPTLIWHVNRTAKITVIADNIAVACSPACDYATIEHPTGTTTQTLHYPTSPHLTDFTPASLCDRFLALAGNGGAQFQVAIRFDNP